MKLYGKKTLAWFLTIATILSLCGTTAFAAVKPTSIKIDDDQTTIGVGETLELSVTVTPSGADDAVDWKVTSGTTYASVGKNTGKVTGKKAGTAKIKAISDRDSKIYDEIEITVAAIEEVEIDAFTVGVGTVKDTVKDMIAAQEATLIYNGGSYEGKCPSTWVWKCSGYEEDEPGDYTFVLDEDGVEGSVTVTVGDITLADLEDATLETIYIAKGTRYTAVPMPEEVYLLLNNSTEEKKLTIGTSSGYFEKWEPKDGGPTGREKFEEVGTYEYTAEPKEKRNYNLPALTQIIEVYDTELETYEAYAALDGLYLDDAMAYIDNGLKTTFDTGLDHIEFTKITGYKDDIEKPNVKYVSGTLYTDDTCITKVSVDDDAYGYEDAQELFFVPNGAGYDTVIEYVAYADEDGKKVMTGTLIITSDTYMILNMDVTNSGILKFSSTAFKTAFEKINDDCDLDYVVFDNDLSGYEGELYYKYNTKYEDEVEDEEYYVKADDDELDLDDVSFVPDEDAEGVISVKFTAYDYDEDVETDGIVHINVINMADIVINAGITEKVPVDVELFEEYLDDAVDTDKIAYIVFDGAPYSTSNGYLVSGDKSFKSSGDKTFHINPDKDEYDLEDLYFVGGQNKGTKRADFEIYYYDGKVVEDDPVTGSVDFITGVSTNIYTKTPLKASHVLNFSTNIEAFENVGARENEYFKFTSLPKDGKLYYNYGMPTQEDVSSGTAYYLGNVSGKKLLKNITFVPSYSSTKQQQVITFEYKAYDENDDYVSGACYFEVSYAAKSDYFPDITTALYADSVDFLKNQGITEGVPGGKYDAAGSLTRAQVVTFLYRAAGEPAVAGATTFKDVAKNEWYYNAVLWASQNGVTNGRSATVFDPNATVTNAEVIQFMYNFDVKYLKHTSYTAGSISSVTDYANVGDWATTAVRWALGKHVLTPGYLYPTNVGTRGSIALYLHRMLTL